MNDKWWMDRGLYGHRVAALLASRVHRTGVHLGNRGIWHSEPRPARLDVSESLVKATGAIGGETDEAGNWSRDIDVRVRHTVVYPG